METFIQFDSPAYIQLSKITDYENQEVSRFDLNLFLSEITSLPNKTTLEIAQQRPEIQTWLENHLLSNVWANVVNMFEAHFTAIQNTAFSADHIDDLISYVDELETIVQVLMSIIAQADLNHPAVDSAVAEILNLCEDVLEKLNDLSQGEGFDYIGKLNTWTNKHDPSGYVNDDEDESEVDESEVYEAYEEKLTEYKNLLLVQQQKYHRSVTVKVNRLAKKLTTTLKPIKTLAKAKLDFELKLALTENLLLEIIGIPEHLDNLVSSSVVPILSKALNQSLAEADFIAFYQNSSQGEIAIDIRHDAFNAYEDLILKTNYS